MQPALSHAHLSRLSDTQLRVALPARAAYDISQPETVSLIIPAAALLSRQPIAASPSFVVAATGGTAVLRGPEIWDHATLNARLAAEEEQMLRERRNQAQAE